MLFKDKLYTIQKSTFENNELIVELTLNSKNDIYKGHFPNNPITPGVCQLEIIKELISIHLLKNIQLKNMSNCKYLQMLIPNNESTYIKISFIETVLNEIKINAIIYSSKETFTKVNAIYSLD